MIHNQPTRSLFGAVHENSKSKAKGELSPNFYSEFLNPAFKEANTQSPSSNLPLNIQIATKNYPVFEINLTEIENELSSYPQGSFLISFKNDHLHLSYIDVKGKIIHKQILIESTQTEFKYNFIYKLIDTNKNYPTLKELIESNEELKQPVRYLQTSKKQIVPIANTSTVEIEEYKEKLKSKLEMTTQSNLDLFDRKEMVGKLYRLLKDQIQGMSSQNLFQRLIWLVDTVEDNKEKWVKEIIDNIQAEEKIKKIGLKDCSKEITSLEFAHPSVYKTFKDSNRFLSFSVEVKFDPQIKNYKIFIHLKKRSKKIFFGNFKKTTLSLEYGGTLHLIALQVIKDNKNLSEKGLNEKLSTLKSELEAATRFHGIPGCAQCLGYTKHTKENGDTQIHILNEYYNGGTLDDSIGKLNKKEILNIALDLSRGLEKIHEIGWVHRDIHGDNILTILDEQNNVRTGGVLADFGLSGKINDPRWLTGKKINTPNIPPEVLDVFLGPKNNLLFSELRKYVDRTKAPLINFPEQFDIWCLGLCFYTIIYNKSPPWKDSLCKYLDRVPGYTLEKVVKEIRNFAKHEPSLEKLPFRHLMWRMLSIDPSDRPSAKEIANTISKIASAIQI